jgi:hypothetical protein
MLKALSERMEVPQREAGFRMQDVALTFAAELNKHGRVSTPIGVFIKKKTKPRQGMCGDRPYSNNGVWKIIFRPRPRFLRASVGLEE